MSRIAFDSELVGAMVRGEGVMCSRTSGYWRTAVAVFGMVMPPGGAIEGPRRRRRPQDVGGVFAKFLRRFPGGAHVLRDPRSCAPGGWRRLTGGGLALR